MLVGVVGVVVIDNTGDEVECKGGVYAVPAAFAETPQPSCNAEEGVVFFVHRDAEDSSDSV